MKSLYKINISTLIISFLIWGIPFLWRVLTDVDIDSATLESIRANSASQDSTVTDTIISNINDKDYFSAALMIFKNNILGCLINVLGGFLLGVGTIANLLFNGIMNADMFCTSYEMGLTIENIFRTTLPHSYELLAFWQSGALGLIISYRLLLSMFEKGSFDKDLFKYVLIQFSIVFLLILIAAFVESYISSTNYIMQVS